MGRAQIGLMRLQGFRRPAHRDPESGRHRQTSGTGKPFAKAKRVGTDSCTDGVSDAPSPSEEMLEGI